MKKKLLSLVLVAAMALSVVACGGKKEEAPAPAAEGKEVLVMATWFYIRTVIELWPTWS